MSDAKFKARNITTAGAWSLFADAGFDAAPGDVIEVQLEDTPASDIWQTVFSCILRSDGRSLPVFTPSTGIAATPTSAVRFTMPAGERGTWSIQCQVNGGESVLVNGANDFTVNTKVRFFAARTANLDLRHPLDDETTQYTPNGPAVATQEAFDAVDAGLGSVTAGAFWIDATTAPAGAPSAKPTRALTTSLTMTMVGAAGEVSGPLKLRRAVTGGGAGTAGTACELPFLLTDSVPADRQAVRWRAEWVSATAPNVRAKAVLSVLNADGEHDYLTVNEAGAVRLHGSAYAHADYLLTVDVDGNVAASAVPILRSYTVAQLTGGGGPVAATYPGGVVICSNLAGGQGLATSDGATWIADRTGLTVA